MESIIITIDGFCSCGKSTLARDLARAMQYKYVDTGAMYRAVTLYFLHNQIDIRSIDAIREALNAISIDFSYETDSGQQVTYLNDEPVEKAIRQLDVTAKVSEVSALMPVREKMVEQQQQFGYEKGIIMDGRDIGTVVFPDAELKIFLTASESTRVRRRYDELQSDGKIISIADVRANIDERDYLDTHRDESPLRVADDAYILDNTKLTMAQQLNWAYEKAVNLLTAN